ncbi:MAG TPA: hypothetical protein VLG91_17355 [Streptomyces sp.]|nr:hypothetical protein [Streptomyces sp.]
MSRVAAVLLASAALIVAVGTSGAVSQEAPDTGRTFADDGFGWVSPQGGPDPGQAAGAGQVL